MVRYIVFMFLFVAVSLQGAGPVLHVYLAERFFELYPKYNEEEQQRFVLGTLFPDIRYIAGVKRTDTHDKEVTLEEILTEKSPFIAGMKYHSWVDVIRDDYVLSDKIYDRLPKELSKYQQPSFLKVVEDEILLEKVNVAACCELLEMIDDEELEQGVSKQDIQRWHTFLQFFFKTSPKTTVTLLSLIDNRKSHPMKEDLDLWMSLVNPVITSEVGKQHTHRLTSHLVDKLKEYKQSTE